jgi:AraC-like DNA-binding protein
MPRDSQEQSLQLPQINRHLSYQPMPIHPLLAPYIKSIEIELPHAPTLQATSPYRIFPGLNVVMGLQYQGELNLLNDANHRIRLQRCGITGLLTNYKNFQAVNHCTRTVLVRFYPWAIPIFFNESANQFTDQSLGLTDILTTQAMDDIEEKLQDIKDRVSLSWVIQQFLLQLYLTNRAKGLPQARIIHIAQDLCTTTNIVSIEALAHNYGYSKRSLERHFQASVGMSPKRFMLTARFQNILSLLQATHSWEKITERLDYYDQSHFIRDIKQFTGLTPSQLVEYCISSS